MAAAAPEGWVTPGRRWAAPLLADAAFRARVAARWHELRANGLREGALAEVGAARAQLRRPAGRNFRRWTRSAGRGHAAETAALRRWLRARVAWIDAHVDRFGDG